MKYNVQQPIIELEIDPTKYNEDQDVKDFMKKKSQALAEAKEALDQKFELSSEQNKILKQVAKKSTEVKERVGVDGRKMGFDDFKTIETAMVKLEERLLPDIRKQQR